MKTTLRSYSKTALLVWTSCILLFSSCKKDDNEIETREPEIESTAGVYVLCEGNGGRGNSEISYFNINTGVTEKNYYKKVNGSNLGETANDLQRYGSKMYCVVSGIQGSSLSFIDVMDVTTAKSLKRIPFNSEDKKGLPRSIAFYKNKAYVSRYDGKVSRIDTATLNIDGEVLLSEGLEGLAVANGKLYVANSDHYLYPAGKKNIVSVIDLNTFTKTKDITVAFNPISVAASPAGDIYVTCAGNYGNIPGSLEKINSITDTKTSSTPGYGYGSLAVFSASKGYVSTSAGTINNLDISTGTPGANFITDNNAPAVLYGFSINFFNNEVYVNDAVDYVSSGITTCFGIDGKKKFSFATATNPKHVLFIYNYKK